MKKYIKAKDVKKLYSGTSEFSLVDIREIGQHTDGHPFFSISIPYSIFESRIIVLVPSKETLIILMDHNIGQKHDASGRAVIPLFVGSISC